MEVRVVEGIDIFSVLNYLYTVLELNPFLVAV